MRSPIAPRLFVIALVAAASGGAGAAPLPQTAPARDTVPTRDTSATTAVAIVTTGTASIGGTVANSDGGAPLRRAVVTLTCTEPQFSRTWVTDEAGRFTFGRLPAGRYTLRATKGGFLASAYGAKTSGGQGLTIVLTAGQRLTDLGVRMTHGGAIAGRISYPSGQGASSVRVQVAQRITSGGETSYRLMGTGMTDDEGSYRAFNLAPGDYVVTATVPVGLNVAPRLTTDDEVSWAIRSASGLASPAPPAGRPVAFSNVVFPGTTDPAAASIVKLGAGEERSNIDFALQLVPTARVTGQISRADGLPITDPQIFAALADGASLAGLNAPIRPVMSGGPNAPTGSFTFAALQPGRYTVIARASSAPPPPPAPRVAAGAPGAVAASATPPPPPPGGVTFGGDMTFMNGATRVPDLWAQADLVVTGEDTSVSLTLQPGLTVSGRVVLNGQPSTRRPPLTTLSVRLVPPPSGGLTVQPPPATMDADGNFSAVGVAPGKYNLQVLAPGGASPTWIARTATSAGRDVLDTPLVLTPAGDITDLVVTMTDRIAELTGSLTDAAGRPAPEFFVVLFPTNTEQWRFQSRWLRPPFRPGSDGTFSVRGMPAGEYYLAAVSEYDQNAWYTPEFLEPIVPLALKLTIADGEKKTQNLRLGR